MLSENKPWIIRDFDDASEFITEIIKLGKPVETTIVGHFNNSGRGSQSGIDLPMHRDGDYSRKLAEKSGNSFDKVVDYVGLFCIKEGEGSTETIITDGSTTKRIKLKKNESIIFDNNICLHGRTGPVGERLLLRVWIEK